MIGEIKQVLTKPDKHNKDGELLHERYAAININVPMDTPQQIKAVQDLIANLSDKDYVVEINPVQGKLFGAGDTDEEDEEEDPPNAEAVEIVSDLLTRVS